MEKQFIVAISRQYGSAGHEIAEKLAERMHVELVDRSMLSKVAERMHMDVQQVEKFEEKPRNIFLSRRVNGFSNSIEENIAEMQFELIKEKAATGESFVVVGRCAETVLKDNPGLISIFIEADNEVKIARIKEKFDLNDNDAENKMERHDKNRKLYHNTYSDLKWGHVDTYDLCINSSRLGLEKTVDVLYNYIQARIEVM